MGRIRGHARPNKSHKDAFAIKGILGVELTASVLELAYLGWNHGAILAVGPIEAPLVGLRIVRTQGQTFEVAGWAIDLDRVQLGAAIPHLEADTSTLKFNPGSGTCQGMQAALQVIFPCTNKGVKIVLPIGSTVGF